MAAEAPPYDVEGAAAYSPIPAVPTEEQPRSKNVLFAYILFSSFILFSVVVLSIIKQEPNPQAILVNDPISTSPFSSLINPAPSRGVAQGVSEKVFRQLSGGDLSFAWTNVMLRWQRTAYHFQPEKNWINGKS